MRALFAHRPVDSARAASWPDLSPSAVPTRAPLAGAPNRATEHSRSRLQRPHLAGPPAPTAYLGGARLREGTNAPRSPPIGPELRRWLLYPQRHISPARDYRR